MGRIEKFFRKFNLTNFKINLKQLMLLDFVMTEKFAVTMYILYVIFVTFAVLKAFKII